MKTIGNMIWFILGGVEWCVALIFAALACCVTIIGIPVGLQLFKLAGFVLWPFGKQVKDVHPSVFKTILNVVWAVLFGWEFALGFAVTGLLYCVTIVGIPFGLQYFKMAGFVMFPLGHDFI